MTSVNTHNIKIDDTDKLRNSVIIAMGALVYEIGRMPDGDTKNRAMHAYKDMEELRNNLKQ